jgi:hypothetical protein
MNIKQTPVITLLSTLLVFNIALSLWGLYNNRISQARICQAIATANDRVMTNQTGAVYDKATVAIHGDCIGNSFFLVPGFSKSEREELMNKKVSVVENKCPDEYANDDAGSAEYLASMDSWTNNFYDLHPNATLSDWSAARHQFYVDNNCTLALQRYQDAADGKADPEIMKQIERSLRETIESHATN